MKNFIQAMVSLVEILYVIDELSIFSLSIMYLYRNRISKSLAVKTYCH